jgi:hypothetical protein
MEASKDQKDKICKTLKHQQNKAPKHGPQT